MLTWNKQASHYEQGRKYISVLKEGQLMNPQFMVVRVESMNFFGFGWEEDWLTG